MRVQSVFAIFTFLFVLFTAVKTVFGENVGIVPSSEAAWDDSNKMHNSITLICLTDGSLIGIETETGHMRWKTETPPLVAHSNHSKGVVLLPDADGALFTFNSEGMIMKLPYTVQQLVLASPFHSDDGLMFLGRKKSHIFTVDLETGSIVRSTGSPNSTRSKTPSVFIGRADYVIEVLNASSDELLASMTYSDYTTVGADKDKHTEGWENKFQDYFVVATNDGRSAVCTSVHGGHIWRTMFDNPIAAIFSPDRIIMYPSRETPLASPDLFSLRYDRYYTLEDYTNALNYISLPDREFKSSDDGKSSNGDREEKNKTTTGQDFDDITSFELWWLSIQRLSNMVTVYMWGAVSATAVILLSVSLFYATTKKSATSQDSTPLKTVVSQLVNGGKGQAKHSSETSERESSNLKSKDSKVRELNSEDNLGGNLDQSTPKQQQVSHFDDEGRRIVGILRLTDDVIGFGSCGTTVFKGFLEDGREVAVKRMVSRLFESADQEISILLEADSHPSVVRYFVREEEDEFVYLALELCKSNLREYIENHGPLTDMDVMKVKTNFKRLLDGLGYLHGLNIVHRDLKPENILIARGSGEWKISDMGLAKKLSEGRVSYDTHRIGSSGWQAPEVLLAERTTKKVDLFCCGCLLFFALTGGKHPFGERYEVDHNITSGARKNLESAKIDLIAKDLILKLTMRIPEARIDISDSLRHPFFWGILQRMKFLQQVSDYIEFMCFNKAIKQDTKKKKKKPADNGQVELTELEKVYAAFPRDHRKLSIPQRLVKRLEDRRKELLGEKDWLSVIDKKLVVDIVKFRRTSYNGLSTCSLLRVLRNKSLHYSQLGENIKKGVFRDNGVVGVYDYFDELFPKLFICVFSIVIETKSEYAKLKHDTDALNGILDATLVV